jgi:hypothetical protein
MKLEEWKQMWINDGFKMVKLNEIEQNDKQLLWVLFSIHVPYSAVEYGRHMGALLVVDKQSGEIMKHDTTNLQGETDEPVVKPSREIYDWFDRHVTEGLPEIAGGIKNLP